MSEQWDDYKEHDPRDRRRCEYCGKQNIAVYKAKIDGYYNITVCNDCYKKYAN